MARARLSRQGLLRHLLHLTLFAMAIPHLASAASQADVPYLKATFWGWVDSGQTKPGSIFHVKAASDLITATCLLHKGADIQGHVVDVQKLSKQSKESRLALSIDSAECQTHGNATLKLKIVQVIGPYSESDEPGHAYLPPAEIQGGGRQLDRSVLSIADNDNTWQSQETITVELGGVRRLKDVTLLPGAGPQGSALLIGKGRNIRLVPKTTLVLRLNN